MSDFINMDFLKLSDGKTDKLARNKNLAEVIDNKDSLSSENTFQLNNMLKYTEGIDNDEQILEETIPSKKKNKELSSKENAQEMVLFSPIIYEDKQKKISNIDTEKKLEIDNKKNNNLVLDLNKSNIIGRKKTKNNISNQHNLEVFKEQIITTEKKLNIISATSLNKKSTSNDTNNLSNIFSSIKKENKKRFSSFFKNYINFTNKKKLINRPKILNFINFNQLNLSNKSDDLETFNNFSKKNIATFKNNELEKDTKQSSNINRYNDFNQRNTLNKQENPEIKNLDTENLNNFDRLKNILDIRSNDVSGRLAEIFERNLKLGKNNFEIQIKPENLGKIEINIEMQGDILDINVKAENSQTVQVLSDNSNSLQKMLNNQGLLLNNFNLNHNNKHSHSRNQNNDLKNVDEEASDKENENGDIKTINSRNLVYIKA